MTPHERKIFRAERELECALIRCQMLAFDGENRVARLTGTRYTADDLREDLALLLTTTNAPSLADQAALASNIELVAHAWKKAAQLEQLKGAKL